MLKWQKNDDYILIFFLLYNNIYNKKKYIIKKMIILCVILCIIILIIIGLFIIYNKRNYIVNGGAMYNMNKKNFADMDNKNMNKNMNKKNFANMDKNDPSGWQLYTLKGCGHCIDQKKILGSFNTYAEFERGNPVPIINNIKGPLYPVEKISGFPFWYNSKTKKIVLGAHNPSDL